MVGETLKDHAETFWSSNAWRLDVTTSDGLMLFSITVFPTLAAAAQVES